jgi:phage regulator Rha-like protein
MLDKLVTIKGNEAFTDTLIISNGTNNKHQNVRELIRKYETEFKELGGLRLKRRGQEGTGEFQVYYELNELQATFLMTLFRNSEIVIRFKLELTKEFFRMRQFILERQTAEWQQARLTGKDARKSETDVILTKLIPHAESQGSKNAGKLYMTYSKLVNSTLGIEAGQRDKLPIDYVDAIKFLERAIENIISLEVDKETHYKEIYQVCKAKCQVIKELAFLPSIKAIGA